MNVVDSDEPINLEQERDRRRALRDGAFGVRAIGSLDHTNPGDAEDSSADS